MKKLILIAFLAGFTACKKCYTCTTTTVTSVSQHTPGYPQTMITTSEACGNKEKTEAEKSVTASALVAGISATSKSTTKCK